MPHMSYRKESRKDYGKTVYNTGKENCTIEQLNCGSLMRIADSLEIIQNNYKYLMDEQIRLRAKMNEYLIMVAAGERKIRALKGVVTKLKKKKH